MVSKIRPKTADQVVQQCKKLKVPYYLGTLVVRVGTPGLGTAVYMPHTGHFFGASQRNVRFDSRQGHNDRHSWMKQLRAFFHQEIT